MRVIKERLLPCMFGKCLSRLINWVIAARRKFPDVPIVSSKIDYKSAYRRCHLSWITAIQTISQLPEAAIALITLRLTFGDSPCPNE